MARNYSEAGKGSRQRPGSGYADGWEAIWGKKMKWRPIETAPKDGTEILGWRRDCGTLLIRYIAPVDFLTERELEREMKDGLSEEDAETPDWFYADFVAGGRLEGDEVPTLWSPLPEPPESN